MRLYYSIHLTGRDLGNSGIQRVVRNLGAALLNRAEIELVPVRWCAETRALVHAELPFQDRIRLYDGPRFEPSERDGHPVHLDPASGSADWLLIAEVPHLGSHDSDYPSIHLSYVTGYARQHDIKVATLLHDLMPLSHFGMDLADEVEPLKWIIYANALGQVDAIFPVSNTTRTELTNWFARNGIPHSADRLIRPVLLPEEMVGIERGRYHDVPPKQDGVHFCMWGSVHRHKNQLAVLVAFVDLCKRRPDLKISLHLFGHVMGEMASRVARVVQQSGGRIHVHGFIDDASMVGIIAKSRASIFMSLAEGYGLPVAESLWLGTPCLTSDLAPMTEIAALGGCLLADPSDQREIADAIELLATNDSVVQKLTREATERPMRTWTDYAGELCSSLEGQPKTAAPYEPYTPVPVVRKPILVSALDIPLTQFNIKDCYRQGATALVQNGVLRYDRLVHGILGEAVLIYGPYLELSRGRYMLRLSGELRGSINIGLTLDWGKTSLGEWHLRDNLDVLEFVLDGRVSQFEILVSRSDDTRLLSIESVFLDRFI